MEKLICALWAPEGEDRATFGARLVESLPPALKAAGASGIRLNIRDAAVEPAAALIQQWQAPQQDAVVQFWLPSANAHFRGAIDAILAEASGRFEAWVVAESTIIPNIVFSPLLLASKESLIYQKYMQPILSSIDAQVFTLDSRINMTRQAP